MDGCQVPIISGRHIPVLHMVLGPLRSASKIGHQGCQICWKPMVTGWFGAVISGQYNPRRASEEEHGPTTWGLREERLASAHSWSGHHWGVPEMWPPRSGFGEKLYRRTACEKESQSWELDGGELSSCEQGPGLDPLHRREKENE